MSASTAINRCTTIDRYGCCESCGRRLRCQDCGAPYDEDRDSWGVCGPCLSTYDLGVGLPSHDESGPVPCVCDCPDEGVICELHHPLGNGRSTTPISNRVSRTDECIEPGDVVCPRLGNCTECADGNGSREMSDDEVRAAWREGRLVSSEYRENGSSGAGR